MNMLPKDAGLNIRSNNSCKSLSSHDADTEFSEYK